jgi:hypothetical protein
MRCLVELDVAADGRAAIGGDHTVDVELFLRQVDAEHPPGVQQGAVLLVARDPLGQPRQFCRCRRGDVLGGWRAKESGGAGRHMP